LLPLELAPSLVAELQKGLPELPDEKKARFIREFALSPYDASVLVAERETAEYFEAMVAAGADAKAAANWLINEYFGRLNKEGLTITAGPLTPQANAAILQMVAQEVISGKVAKDVLTIIWTEGGDPRDIVERRGLKQVSDVGALETLVDEIVANNPDKVADAQANPKAIGWFVGQVMKASGGKANPQTVNALLKKRLEA
jgi:aspartyl-tRNA(Asn)/glutamyl-tRNA(Gln) amidotransferase subunit B